MPLFDLQKKTRDKKNSKEIVGRVSKSTPPPIMMKASGAAKKGDVMTRINNITTMVSRNLGKYTDNYRVIREENELKEYIDKCIENNIISIDTETSGLDPLRDNLAGICVYTPGEKAAYIPLNHISYVTGLPVENVISMDYAKSQFERLNEHNVKGIYFNAKFDLRVLKNQLGVNLKPYWDGYIAAKLLNENEPSHGLKKLHNKYCLDGEGDAFSFDELFEGFNFQYIPIRVGYLYAARDAEITYELYKFQEPYLTKGTEECKECDLEKVCDIFWDIEMPLISVLVDLEDTGIEFDYNVTEELSEKYHKLLEESERKFHEFCSEYSKEIDSYRRIQGINCKLDDPIAISSPAQLSILLYDILKLESKSKDNPRGTGEEVLSNIDHPISKAILEYRGIAKLITTFIDKLPQTVNPNDGRIHASFNAGGTVTGRLSSSNPNCISKGTLISCPGEEKKIEDIQVGDMVYCIDPKTGLLHVSEVLNKWNKGIQKCIKLIYQSVGNYNLKYLILTPDHKVLTRTNGFIAANKLKLKERIYHLYRGRTYDEYRLYTATGSLGGNSMIEHQFLRDEYFKCPIIHHKNNEHWDNRLENLQPCYTKKEHSFWHKEKNKVKLPMESELPQNFIEKNYSLITKDEWLYILEVYCYVFTNIPMDYGTLLKYLKKFNIDHMKLKAESEYCTKYRLKKYKDEDIIRIYKENNFDFYKTQYILKCDGPALYRFLLNKNLISENHKLVAVEECEPMEVFDIEVEKYHTFIANEICVSNCQQIPSRGPGKEVRHMFRATSSKEIKINNTENIFKVDNLYSQIPTDRGYVYLDELKIGDKLIIEDSGEVVKVNVIKIEIETGSIYYDFE